MDLAKEQLQRAFNKAYSPDVDDNITERMSNLPKSDPQLLSFIREINLKRKSDPFIGAKIAGEEIYINLIEALKTENGVHAETLLAIIGALGGHECINSFFLALRSVVSDNSPEKTKEKGAAGLLDILMVETDHGETFIMGDRIGNIFMSFYCTAANDNTINTSVLSELSTKVASQIGNDDYWKTSFNDYIPESPKKLLDMFEGKFENSLKLYCFSPQERMIAFAVAAQKTVQQAKKIMDKQRALDIIADYGWRTSHFLFTPTQSLNEWEANEWIINS